MDYVIKQTETFAKWLLSINDLRAQLAVARRIERASAGNFGDIKTVGEGVSEMRIDMGAG